MKSVISLLEKSVNSLGGGLCDAEFVSQSQIYEISRAIASNIVDKTNLRKPIAILAEQNVKTIEMMFATTLSGNFYALLDPTSPTSRIEEMLSGIDFLLCSKESASEELLDKLSKKNIKIAFYENLVVPNKKQDKLLDEIATQIDEKDPLYMVFTSGSTGKPKGVVKSHGAILSFIEAFLKEFKITANDVIANQTPLYFDASAKDVYLSLASGAKLYFVPKNLFSFPVKLIEYLNKIEVTTILWVPSALTIVAKLNAFKFIKPTTLKRVFFVGEVFQSKYLNYWMENLPEIEFVNIYGSSETAGVVCYYRVERMLDEGEVLPIGKPFSNTKIYLVDENGKDASEGEMVIESSALASEYFGDEEKTKQRFVSFGDKRYYRTGDMAKRDKLGNFVFVSRNDFQIKHMGHRIELGEIENVAYCVDEIAEACAVYNQEKQKIILYYSLLDAKTLDEKTFKQKLKEKLPTYMIPAVFVLMDTLPKNKNGKIDRQKLKELN